MIKPLSLAFGDKIGLLSLSSTCRPFPRRWQRSIAELNRKGFTEVVVSSTLGEFHGQSGTIEQRSTDLHSMLEDKSISGILSTTGGNTTIQVLESINFTAFLTQKKIICGFSDTTVLLNAITKETGLTTFYGPALLPCFGDAGGILHFTWQNFSNMLMKNEEKKVKVLCAPTDASAENLLWDITDIRPRRLSPASAWYALGSGIAEGIIVGGHLGSICLLIGTRFQPTTKDRIVFLESTSSDQESVAHLEALRLTGFFDDIVGLLWGRQNPEGLVGPLVMDFLIKLRKSSEILVLLNVDFGHTEPRIILPIGAPVGINADTATIHLIDSYVI